MYQLVMVTDDILWLVILLIKVVVNHKMQKVMNISILKGLCDVLEAL